MLQNILLTFISDFTIFVASGSQSDFKKVGVDVIADSKL